jgi:TetR/AcrR family transcriptional repressor of nem operon
MDATPPRGPDTATRMLDIAERLAQTRGFNGFSYSDIAAELGIAKASLHHHFATKADLGRALMQRYSDGFEAALAGIEAGPGDAYAKLSRYAMLYEDVLVNDRLCLCGMLAAEYSTLPPEMRAQVRRFFEKNEDWLSALIERGRKEKSLRPGAPARDVARMIVSALEGAMLLARSCEDPGRFASCVAPVLGELGAKSVRKKKRPR